MIKENGGGRLYLYWSLTGMLFIGAGFYNLLMVSEFTSLHPSVQGSGPTWLGVIAPLIIGVIILAVTTPAYFSKPGPLNQKLREIKKF